MELLVLIDYRLVTTARFPFFYEFIYLLQNLIREAMEQITQICLFTFFNWWSHRLSEFQWQISSGVLCTKSKLRNPQFMASSCFVLSQLLISLNRLKLSNMLLICPRTTIDLFFLSPTSPFRTIQVFFPAKAAGREINARVKKAPPVLGLKLMIFGYPSCCNA